MSKRRLRYEQLFTPIKCLKEIDTWNLCWQRLYNISVICHRDASDTDGLNNEISSMSVVLAKSGENTVSSSAFWSEGESALT